MMSNVYNAGKPGIGQKTLIFFPPKFPKPLAGKDNQSFTRKYSNSKKLHIKKILMQEKKATK